MADYNLKTPERPVGLLQAVEKLMYWAQVSLPAVYGEELTYAKEQGKMAEKINEVVEQLNVNTEWTEYLLNEGVENETVIYVNELINNGTLSSLINNELLGDINQQVVKNTTDIEGLKTTKADKEMITNIINGSVKGVYANLAALQAAYPTGAQGIYVTSDNGHWYYYNNGWKDGGVYQAAGFDNEFNLKTDIFNLRISGTRGVLTLPDAKPILLRKGDVVIMNNEDNDPHYVFAANGNISQINGWTERFVCLEDVEIPSFNIGKLGQMDITMTAEDAQKILKSFTINGRYSLASGSLTQVYYNNFDVYKGTEFPFLEIQTSSCVLNSVNVGDLIRITDEAIGEFCLGIRPKSGGSTEYFGSKSLYITLDMLNNFYILLFRTNRLIENATTIIQPCAPPFNKILIEKVSDKGLISCFDSELNNEGYVKYSGVIANSNPTRMIYQNLSAFNKSNYTLASSDGYQVAGFNRPGNINTGWQTQIVLDENNVWDYYMVRRVDDGAISESDNINKVLKMIKPSTPITYSTINNFINTNDEKVIFVNGESGNDNNNGGQLTPVKTITKGLSLSTNIRVTPGTYYETINLNNQPKVSITMNHNSSYSSSVPDRPTIKLINGVRLTFVENESIYRVPYSITSGSRMDRVFNQKTLPPIDKGSRSDGWNVGLIEEGLGYSEQIFMTPVLTLAEVQSAKGTWTYVNGYIYMNPTNALVSNYYLLNETPGSVVSITNCNEVILEDLTILGSYNQAAVLRGNNNMKVSYCKFALSALSDASTWDNSNAEVLNCYGYRARNDGFNIHNYGETHFINCYGIYNYDDGISHHDGTVGYIEGGEYHHNGKGGISPTYGSIINCSDVYTHNNVYGFYQAGSSDYQRRTVQWSSCLSINNNVDIDISYYDVIAINCIYKTKNVATVNGSLTEYGSTVIQ